MFWPRFSFMKSCFETFETWQFSLWKISLNVVNFIRKVAKKMQIYFLWRILDPNWVHLMIEKRAKLKIKFGFQIFALFNWIKFQIACNSLTVFFCYFSNKNFVKMMEIPPGNIDHFELKCRSLKEVKNIFQMVELVLMYKKKVKFPTWKRKWLINVVREWLLWSMIYWQLIFTEFFSQS